MPETAVRVDSPPSPEWQAWGYEVMQTCAAALGTAAGAKARAWLRGRGLTEATMQRFQLGYNPTPTELAGYHLPRGIVIPQWQESSATLWGLKVRLPASPGQPTYQWIEGSCQNLFNADSLIGRRTAWVCEGEMDTMLLWQEAGDLVGVVALGHAAAELDPAWSSLWQAVEHVYLALPDNQTGRQAREQWLALIAERVQPVDLPAGQTITRLWRSGQSLRAWVLETLPAGEWPKVIRWPATIRLAAIGDQWRRLPDGQIEATYHSAGELALCLELMGSLAELLEGEM